MRSTTPSLDPESRAATVVLSVKVVGILLVIADQQDFSYREYADTRAAARPDGVPGFRVTTVPPPGRGLY